MNRLILLGNGFDLAHGMKTSYNDFILWYLTQALEHALDYQIYDDDVLKVQKHDMFYSPFRPNIRKIIEFYYYNNSFDELFEDGENKEYHIEGEKYQLSVTITIQTRFMKTLLYNCSITNWVDIENRYYDALKEVINTNFSLEEKDTIHDLNETMAVLIKKLESYLQTLEPIRASNEYGPIISGNLKATEFVHWNKVKVKQLTEIMVLNFNYTSTASLYINENIGPGHAIAKINYIHGELGKPGNPMIFGFGDELDENYKKLEDHQTKGVFKHIKSFSYFKTRNYHNLIRYLSKDHFQVYILGHSCGLSDRTMLNMIFEHDNCMSIKIYYHQISQDKNNYTDLTEEISRHFKSKTKMRERIVPFEDCRPMPQID